MSQIGLSSKVEIDDGASSAFVEITNVTSLGCPDITLGMVESKRLNITNRTIRKVPAMFDRGEITITYEFSDTEKDRLDGLRDAVTEKSFKFTIEYGVTDWTETIKGYVTKNVINEVVADEIVTCTATITFSGEDAA
jgi:hypothetical protein